MPIYEYICNRCGKEFCTVTEKPSKQNPACPNCGFLGTVKVWNTPPVIFKTGGFYTSDTKKDGDETDVPA